MKITNTNLKNFCRTCLVEINDPGERYNIQDTTMQLLTDLISIDIKNDDRYPKFLCELCHTSVQHFEDFRSQAIHSHKILEDTINDGEIECKIDPDAVDIEMLLFDDQYEDNVESQQKHLEIKTSESDHCDKTLDYDAASFASEPFSDTNDGEDGDADDNVKTYQTPKSTAKLLQTSSSVASKIVSTPAPVNVASQRKSDSQNSPFVFVSCEQKTAVRSASSSSNKIPSNKMVVPPPKKRTLSTLSKTSIPTMTTTKKKVMSVICTYNNCRQTFKNFDLFRLHYRREHPNSKKTAGKEIVCPYNNCGEVFRNSTVYRIHHRAMHNNTKPKERQVFICEECGKTYKTRVALKMHSYRHVPESEYPFACEHCSKRFYTPRTYKIHLMRHAGVKNFECPHCGLKKTTRHEMREHINMHTKERRFICTICSKEFSRAGGLSIHTRVIHRGIKPYSCRFCTLSFGKTFARKQHEMTHTGERPYTCELCDRGFIQAVALRSHMKTHQKRMEICKKD